MFVFLIVACNAYTLVLDDYFYSLANWVPTSLAGQATGNNELEYYTTRHANVYTRHTSNGNALILKVQSENYNGYDYTSGKVISKNTYGPYGFFNVKALVPKGNGLWPAIWLLPPNAVNAYGTWAACGEIDIMETICENNPGYSTLHFGGEWPNDKSYGQAWGFAVNWTLPHYFGVTGPAPI